MTVERVGTVAADTFAPLGLGWRAVLCDRTVQFTVRRLRHDGGVLRGYVDVEFKAQGRGTPRERLAGELLNLSSGRDRSGFANRLQERKAGIEWRNLVDAFCVQVESREAAGPELVWVGNLPAPIDGGWLLENLIQRKQTTGIHGDGSVGKSFFALAVAVSLTTGMEVIPGFRPASRCNVVYCDYETDSDTMNLRVQMIAAGLGIDAPDIAYYRMEQPLADSIEWLLPKVQEHGIGLVIVDSVEAAMSGSSGNGAPANDAPAKMNRALRQLGVSALLIDHINSDQANQKEAARRAYGSIFKRNWQRMSFHLKQSREPGPDKVRHLGLFNTKFNNGEEGGVTGLAWGISDGICQWWAEEIDDPDLEAALPTVDRIAAYLRREGPCQPSVIADETGVPGSTVRSTLTRHIKRFTQNERGLWTLRPEQIEEAEPSEELPWA